MERINAKDIIYIEIENRKTKIVTMQKVYQSAEHINFWRERLTGSVFISPHKSFIINFNFVTAYQRDYVVLDGKYRIPIARTKQTSLHKQFIRFMEGK